MLPVAVLAGGFATRLRPLTEAVPKAMIEVAGRPFIDWQLRLLSKSGIEKVVLCVAYRAEMIQDFVGDGSRYGIEVTYSEDGPALLGTAGAICKALPLLGEDFMVLYGDSYLPIDYEAVVTAFWSSKKPALMTVYRNEGAFDTSNVIFANGKLQKYAKGSHDLAMTHIDYGLSVFSHSVFESPSSNIPTDLSDICENLSLAGLLGGYEVHERFFEIGSLEGIQDFSKYVERNRDVL